MPDEHDKHMETDIEDNPQDDVNKENKDGDEITRQHSDTIATADTKSNPDDNSAMTDRTTTSECKGDVATENKLEEPSTWYGLIMILLHT